MLQSLQIKNPNNGIILRCQFGKTLNLSIIDHKIKTGISVPPKSFLERTPTVDMFIKKALNNDFKQRHIDLISEYVESTYKV